MPPDTLFGRQIRIERLCDGGPERVENARILLLSGHAFEVTIQALGTAPRQLLRPNGRRGTSRSRSMAGPTDHRSRSAAPFLARASRAVDPYDCFLNSAKPTRFPPGSFTYSSVVP